MRRYFYLILTVLFPLLSFSQQWKTFTDTAGKFTASYPANWVNKVKEGNRVFFTSPADSESDIFYENINISVTQKAGYGTEITVKDLFPAVTTTLKKQYTNFKEEGVRYFKWNNMNAAEIIFSGKNKLDESFNTRTIQWYCFFKSRLYLVTFVAQAEFKIHNETAKKIMTGILFK